MKKIEIVMWYNCNCRCVFCASVDMAGEGFSTEEIGRMLRDYRAAGATQIDFGGGEPTVRNDLPALARAARKLGYEKIGVKSNGMRFCYPEYVDLCMKSGVNDFAISLWGASPEVHDRLCGRPGAFEMTEMGLKHLVDSGADVCVDFLVTTETVGELPGALEKLRVDVGVKRFSLWLFSIFGAGGAAEELLPSMKEAGKTAEKAAKKLEKHGGFLKTSHIPPCMLGARRDIYYNIRDLDLLIITPGSAFRGEESPFETGARVPACAKCRLKRKCPGPRREYVDHRGAGEFRAVV